MYDILVLGAGISGLSAALHAAEKGFHVVILTKGAKPDGSSNYAQGGIAMTNPEEKSQQFKAKMFAAHHPASRDHLNGKANYGTWKNQPRTRGIHHTAGLLPGT